MKASWVTLQGVILQGHRVASGHSKEYPYSSLEMQKPLFKAHGFDLDPYYLGTLNISIAPLQWEMVKPQLTFRAINWTNLHPPEDFSFSPCRVIYDEIIYEGWVYYPHPETKIRNFQDSSIIEVISTRIPGLFYGSRLQLELNPQEIHVFEEDSR